MLNIIKPIKQRHPDLIPRHPERKNDIGKACSQLNLTYSIKFEQNIPILNDDLYIVDKFGLFFSIAISHLLAVHLNKEEITYLNQHILLIIYIWARYE